MFKKLIFVFTFVFILIIISVGFKDLRNKESFKEENIIDDKILEVESNTFENLLEAEKEENIFGEDKSEKTNNDSISKEVIAKEQNTKETIKKENSISSNKKTDKVIENTTNNKSESKKDEPKESQSNTGKENASKDNIVQDTEVKEPEKVTEDKPKEKKTEYIYNATETNVMIADVNSVAKQNKNLWNENGDKLYSVKVTPEAMKGNYFSPYRRNQIEAKVLYAYSVTVQVYAADYTIDGVFIETRYYIRLATYDG